MTRPEVVLLIEESPDAIHFRPVLLKQPVSHILERCHLSPQHEHIRTWHCTNGERCPTGQRLFREVLPPPPPEPVERPLYDELLVKDLPFTRHARS